MRLATTIITAAAVALGVALWVSHTQPQSAATTPTNTAFERIMQTGVIRCGYAAWDPMLRVDPTTKEVSGMARDVIQAAARYLDLKVEWTEEVGWGEFNQALHNQRIDVFCAGGSPNSERAKASLISAPFVFADLSVIVRADDTRFDADVRQLNQPTVRFGQIDGTTAAKIVRTYFAAATAQGYADLVPYSQLALEVASGKIDATLIPRTIFDLYNQQHPGVLKRLEGPGVNRYLPTVFFVSRHEPQLLHALDTAIREILDAGVVAQAIERYQTVPGAFLLPDQPYQTNK